MEVTNIDPADLTVERAFELAAEESKGGTSKPGSDPAPLPTSPKGQGEDGAASPDSSDPLESLEVETLLSHPTLGPKVKSHIDKEWANQSRGQRTSIEQELRANLEPAITQQVTERVVGEFLDGLSDRERADYFVEHPNLAVVFGRYQEAQEAAKNPPPPGPDFAPVLAVIRANLQRIEAAGFPDEVRTKLHPDNFRDQGNEGLQKWTQAILDAEVDHKVTSKVGERTEAQRTAEGAERDAQSALLNNGSPAPVLGNLEEDPPQLLLERAFAMDAAARKG